MNSNAISEALQQQGFSSFSAWARAAGYNPIKAHTSVKRWLGKDRKGKVPRGETYRIIKQLEAVIGQKIIN